MVTAEAFVRELEEKNQGQAKRLLDAYVDMLTKEKPTPADLLRLEQKAIVEAVEVAALWLADSESLQAKVDLAEQCGDGARHYRAIADRLADLGLPDATYDPRFGGYTKLFALFRAMQSVEERVSASPVTLKQIALQRYALCASHCEQQGDGESARIFRESLIPDEDRHVQRGRQSLVLAALNEESQARARRASFRTIELLGDIYEPSMVRKFLTRSLRK